MTIPIQIATDFTKTSNQLQELQAKREDSVKRFPRNHAMRQHFDNQISALRIQKNQLLMQTMAKAA